MRFLLLIASAMLILQAVAVAQVVYDDPDLDEMMHWRGIAEDTNREIAEVRQQQRFRFPKITEGLAAAKADVGTVQQFTSKWAERERAQNSLLSGFGLTDMLPWLLMILTGGTATTVAVKGAKHKRKAVAAEAALQTVKDGVGDVIKKSAGNVSEMAGVAAAVTGATVEKLFKSGLVGGNGKTPPVGPGKPIPEAIATRSGTYEIPVG